MPRQARNCPGGYVYHVWNRAAGRLRLFKKDEDFQAFSRIMIEAHQRHPIAVLEWCLMPNHWHFVVRPVRDDQVTNFFRWLTHTHAVRAITHRRVMGMGPLYQGRFKTLPVETDEHLETLLRYVQRNPVRANLVRRVEQWKWSGAWSRRDGDQEMKAVAADWPIQMPKDWRKWVNAPQTRDEVKRLREHVQRSRPYGSSEWVREVANKLNLEWTLRSRGGQPQQNPAR